ncbi:GNAT family N-acetyltransferase [Oricola thermophila]|uniref:GNAT family N-acetyltransferase n=1 Tax=Oricola thermophila TaxID=2742145 RepID=A0A6N1V827_9HYPH|nr:GNAT family N-acetyltransferase [Oricola thermophila]QKV17091.1 GNAT family N-acetyltransferase [Oricola thermophila]
MPFETPVCRRVATREEMDACFAIRETVFIAEQNVDPAIERDGLDEQCIHYIAESGGLPVATARARFLGDKIKIERVAVLKEARGTGTGAALMRFLMVDLAADEGAAGRNFFLSSQSPAIRFYERLGFSVCSEEYMEAGIPHRDMRAEISD